MKSLREEAPRYAAILPQLPRLLHRHLETSHKAGLDVASQLHKDLEQQKKIAFRLSVAIVVLLGLLAWQTLRVGL
jgi:hypothetical protein